MRNLVFASVLLSACASNRPAPASPSAAQVIAADRNAVGEGAGGPY